ncbi:class I mannose-6-phosphate isomerase [bacterium]|nr:class I mannose-6-phosphate isomerase [bacterium]
MSERLIVYPLLMQPWVSARPWGGRRLETRLGKTLPDHGGPWGEVWEVSDHPDGHSRIANGPYAGMEFGELLRRFPELVGLTEPPLRFPLIVKYIDASEDLSVQVHPDDARAPRGETGKCECWFIMDCPEGAEIVLGMNNGTDAGRLAEAARAGTIDSCIRRVPIHPGDFVQIPPGTVHAILGGTLLCEVQQCSNTTYRLWDWNRQPARPLHIDDACRVCDYGARPPMPVSVGTLEAARWHTLVTNNYFQVQTISWPAPCRADVDAANDHGLILNVVEGSGRMIAGDFSAPLKLGQSWFMPAGLGRFSIEADTPLRFLATRSMQLKS